MTITLDQYHTLRRRAERLRQKAAEADGALKEVLRQVKEQFGCSTLKEAKALLAELEAKERKLGARYAAEMAKFQSKWGDVLDGKIEGKPDAFFRDLLARQKKGAQEFLDANPEVAKVVREATSGTTAREAEGQGGEGRPKVRKRK